MADRYWVGGTNTWNTTAGTKWATTSGGTGGASVPTAADDVFFTNLSTGTVSVTATTLGKSLNFTGFTGTITFNANATLAGNLTLSSGMTVGTSVSVITFNANATITSAGKTLPAIGVNGSGITVQLADALSLNTSLSLTTGTFATNDYAVSLATINSSNSNSRTFNFGGSTVSVSGNVVFTTSTNLTLSGTYIILMTGAAPTFTGGSSGTGISVYELKFQGSSGTKTINGRNTFENLTVVAPAATTGVVAGVAFGDNQTINGILSTSGTQGNARVYFRSSTGNVQYQLTINGTTSLTDADFKDIIIRGTAVPISGTRIGNRGSCQGITFSTPKTVYWTSTGAWTDNLWAPTSGGTANTDNFPLAQDTAVINNSTTGASFNFSDNDLAYPNLDMSSRTTALTVNLNATVLFYGGFSCGSGITFGGTSGITFSGDLNKTIVSNGKVFPGNIVISAAGGIVELGDSLTIIDTLSIGSGKFVTNDFSVTSKNFLLSGSLLTVVSLGASVVTLTGDTNSNTPFRSTAGSNLIFNAGSSVINFTASFAFEFGTVIDADNINFNTVNFTSTAANQRVIIFGDSNSFQKLMFSGPATAGVKLFTVFSSGTAYSIDTLEFYNTSVTNRVLFSSGNNSENLRATINTLTANHCDFKGITITGSAVGTAPTGAGDCGNNSGIVFPTPKTVYKVTSGTNVSANIWALTSGGAANINNFPLAQDTIIFDGNSNTSITFNTNYNLGTFDSSARTTACTFSFTVLTYPVRWHGSVIFCSTASLNSGGPQFFSGPGIMDFVTAGKTLSFSVTVETLSGTLRLQGALTWSSATQQLNVTAGGFDANGYNVTVGRFDANNPNIKSIKMGSGLWTILGVDNTLGSSMWGIGPTNTTFDAGTANILLTNTTTSDRFFGGGGFAYNKLTIGGTSGVSTLTIGDNNFFSELASTKTVAHTIGLGTTTQRFGKWTVTGTVGNVVTITGTGTAHQIIGPATSGINYLAMGSIGFSANSPGEFYAGANSTGTGANVIRSARPAPRTLYWRGGTGNWSASTFWSLTSGGAGGQTAPRSFDTVIFNSASSATDYTVTVNSLSRCGSLTISGPASGNLTLAGTFALIAHGSVTFPATGMIRTWTGDLTLSGDASGYVFTTNGVSLSSAVNINGANSGWSLGSDLTCTNLNVNVRSFDTGANYNITCSTLSSNDFTPRSIVLNASQINLSGNVTFTNSSRLTFNAGTSQINLSAVAPSLGGGTGQTFNDVSFTNTGLTTPSITGANTFNNLNIAGRSSTGVTFLSINGNQTINGTLTLSAGTDATCRTFVRSNTIGTTCTLTCNAVLATDVDFRDITIAGSAAPVSGTRLGDCKGNSGITFDAPKTVYYRSAASANWGSDAWSATNNGSLDITQFPLAQDIAVFPSSPTPYPTSGNTVTINAVYNIGTIDMSARTSNTMTLAVSSAPAIYGNWINGTGTTLSGTVTMTFAGRGSQTITSAGRTFTQPIVIDSPSGSVTLQDAYSNNRSSSGVITLTNGTFDAGGYNVTLSGASSSFVSSNTNIRTAAIGSGTWTIAGSNGWDTSTPTNLTVTGTGTINLTSGSSKTFAGGGLSYSGITLNQGGTGQLTITGNNTFGGITDTVAGPTTIVLGSTVQRVGAFQVTGTVGNVVSITGNTSLLVYTNPGVIGGLNYLNVEGRVYGPNGEVSGVWFAGTNSTSTANGSLGWEFTTGVAALTATITESYTSAETQDTLANVFNPSITENSDLADIQISAGTYGVTITENANLADSSNAAFTIIVSVTEGTNLAEFQAFVSLFTVSITENSTAGDIQTAVAQFNSALTENTALADAAAVAGVFSAIAVENAVLADTASAQTVFAALQQEGFTVNDISNIFKLIVASITEGATLAEASATAVAFAASISEGLVSAETESALRRLVSSINETLTVADTQVAQAVFTALRAEGLTVADIQAASRIVISSLTEGMTLAETEAAATAFIASITENLVSDNTQTALKRLVGSIAENLNSAEAQTTQANFNAARVEPSTLADVSQAQVNFNAAITEATSIADILDAVRTLVSAITENSNIADSQDRVALFFRSDIEGLISQDNQAGQANFNSNRVENLLISDQQVGYGWFRVVDDQTIVWSNINNTQTAVWSNVVNNQAAVWANVNNTQSTVWINIGDDQNPSWVQIDNSQP